MPRKRRDEEAPMEANVTLMLPAPRTTGHGHTHGVDPYAAPPGSVAGAVTNEKIVASEPLRRSLTAAEKQKQGALVEEQRALGEQYDLWIDTLIRVGGEKPKALAIMFNISEEEASLRQIELEAIVSRGMSFTDVGRAYEKNYLGIAEQAKVLARWVYSDNPGASINAMKLVIEANNSRAAEGSFEAFLRLSKSQEAANSLRSK